MDVLIYRWYHHEYMDGKNDILKQSHCENITMIHFFLLPLVLRLTQRIVKLDIPWPWLQFHGPRTLHRLAPKRECLGQGGFPFHIFEVCTGAHPTHFLVGGLKCGSCLSGKLSKWFYMYNWLTLGRYQIQQNTCSIRVLGVSSLFGFASPTNLLSD